VCKYKRLKPGQRIGLHLRPCNCPACGYDFDYDGVFVFEGHSIRGKKILCTFRGNHLYRCPRCLTEMKRFVEFCQDQHLFRFLTNRHIQWMIWNAKVKGQEVKCG
jgi:hypothetical protein